MVNYPHPPLEQAKLKIGAHKTAHFVCDRKFATRDQAATAWLTFKEYNPNATIEDWINYIEPGTYAKRADRHRLI